MDVISVLRWLEFAGLGLFFSVLAALPFILSDDGRRPSPVDDEDE